jgi:hypothetical protein
MTPASQLEQRGQIMPKFEYRFDIAAILLASVLTVLGLSAEAGSKPGGATDGRSQSGAAGSSGQHGSSGRHGGAAVGGFTQTGGISGGVVGSYYRFGK